VNLKDYFISADFIYDHHHSGLQTLIFIDGSVAAKGQPKKKFIVRLKAILTTLKIV